MPLENTLLVVDDQKSNRTILRKAFEDSYAIMEAENGQQALDILQQHRDDIAAVLLDVIMPIKDGYQVLAEMKELDLLSSIPVIVISSADSTDHELKSFRLGASDVIIKPYQPLVMRRRVQNAVDLSRHKNHLQNLVDEQSLQLRRSTQVIVDTLATLVESRSMESGQHILRIRRFTKLLLDDIARIWPEYELTDHIINLVASAAALHDIGKISIPDAILNKPGRLTPEEFEIMKTHSVMGCQVLESLHHIGDQDYLRYAYHICRHHHERWDGKGYPDKLSGDDIPIYAQAVGLADAYDALTTKRVYKDAFSHEKALNMILNGECGTFSPKLLECVRRIAPQFAELSQKYSDGSVSLVEEFSAPAFGTTS